MIYLRQFETTAAYDAAKSGLILPNVSLITENDKVEYNPYVDPYGGHDYVEIGGLKWATMNIGANSITDTGLYFQWGDTQGYTASEVGSGDGKKYFGTEDYKYWTADTGSGSSGYTKYSSTDGKTVLDLSDDAVAAAWGGSWRMPTTAEFQALGTATTSAWTSSYEGSGVAGLVLTSNADSSKKLFFPFTGYADRGSFYNLDTYIKAWSSSLSDQYKNSGFLMFTTKNSNIVYWDYTLNRAGGFAVRGVVG